jgi:hypothetical protein
MQATITYLLTEQAQRAQMAATGQPVARKQTMSIEVTADDLPLCKVAEDGSLSIDTAHEHEPALVAAGWHKANPIESQIYAPDVLGDIRAGTVILDAAYAEACRIASQYVRDSDESMSHPENSYHLYVPYTVLAKTAILHAHPRIDASKYDKYGIYSTDLAPDAIELLRTRSKEKTQQYFQDCAAGLDRLTNYDTGASIGVGNTRVYDISSSSSPIVAAAHARWKARGAEAARVADAAAEVREAAKTDAIDAFVAASGDALLQQQYADELLCRKTVIGRMANAALDAAGLPAECPDSVVCNDHDCPCGDSSVDCIPPKVYARWKAISQPDIVTMFSDGATGSYGETSPGPDKGKDWTVEFHKVRNCLKDDDDRDQYSEDAETAGSTEYHALVTIPSGPFQFTRRIKV